MADLAGMGIITGTGLIMPELTAEVAGDLVKIEGGTFDMGADDLTEREQPIHPVGVSSFRMQAHQVTVSHFAVFSEAVAQARHVLSVRDPKRNRPIVLARAADPKAFDSLALDSVAELFSGLGGRVTFGALRGFMESLKVFEVGRFKPAKGFDRPNQPVVSRTWYEALAFLASVGLRLPTEAEREYAAKGPTHRAKYGTASEDNLSHAEARFYDPSGDNGLVDVGSYQANGFRLFDMAGNAYDWVVDWFGNYPTDGQLIQNPTGPLTGKFRVVRGGGWNINEDFLRSADRLNFGPDVRRDFVGFRGVSPEDSIG